MKKFFLIVLFPGIFTIAAAVLMLTTAVVPDLLKSAPPVRGLPLRLRDFPVPERSVVAVKLELPLAVLTEKANQSIPRELSGVKYRNFHETISGGVVNWKMWPGQASIRNTGKGLSFHLPIRGKARVTGGLGLGFFKLRVSGNSKMNGTVTGSLMPMISSDWQVRIPELDPQVSIHQAQINMAGIEISNARAKIQECLTQTIRSESANTGACLTKALHLKEGVRKLWDQAHINRLLPAEHTTWAVFDPGQVEMGPIDYSDPAMLSLTVGLVAESFVTNLKPLDRHPGTLPDLVLKPNHPVTDIRIPVIVNFGTLTHTLANQTFSIKTRLGPTVCISAVTVESGQSGYLNLGINTTVQLKEKGTEWSTRIRVRAKPIVNCLDQTLSFTDVSLGMGTRASVNKALGWLLNENLVNAITKELRIDLKEYLPKVENEIQKVITSVPIPDNFELQFEMPEVNLIEAYTVTHSRCGSEFPSPGLVLVVGAKANIAVRMRKL